MKIKKICEYLCDIGLLEIKDINYFLKIYSQIEKNKCKRELDKLKISLFSYFNIVSKNDNQLIKLCRNIVDSFINNQIVLKYRTLNSLCNLFNNKINILLSIFFFKLNINIKKKKKNKFIVQPIYFKANKLEINNKNKDKNNEAFKCSLIPKMQNQFTLNDISNDPKNRITADDVRECTFSPIIHEYKPKEEYFEINEKVKSYTYYSPSFNILAKLPTNKNSKNNKLKINKYNYLNNNINLTNFSENINNGNYIERYNTFNEDENKNRNNRYNKDSFSSLDIYNLSPQIKDNYFYDDNYFVKDNYLYKFNNEYNQNRSRAKTPRQTQVIPNEIFNNFLLKQDKHVKDVEKKILNLKIEQRKKEDKECSFTPEIHYYNNPNRIDAHLQNISNNLDNFSSYQNNIISFNSYLNSNSNTNMLNNNNYNYTYRSNGKSMCPKFEGSLSPQEDKFTKEFYNLEKRQKRPHSVSQEFFDKLSNENSDKSKRIEELRKKIINYDFSTKIEYNKKYKIKDSFEERQARLIENKKILRNKKEDDEKMFVDEMNKMYRPTRKCREKDIVEKLYNKEEVDKIKERNKKEETKTKKKNIINWQKRLKEKKKNSKFNIYEFSKTNKIITKKYRDKYYDLIIMDKAVLRDIGKLNEFFHNHNLLKLIFEKPFDESAGNFLLRFYARQVIRGYDIFDRNDFGHFDIKPENLLVTINLVIKLSDFSLLKVLKDNMKLPGGTQGFMTQEYYVEKYFSKGNAKKQDYFALGSCLFILKYGIQMLKFKKYDDKKMCADRIIDLLQRNIMFIKTRKESDKDFKDFLISLIQYKPEQRPSFEQIYRNKWLNKDSEELNNAIMAFESDEEKLIMELQKKDFLIKVEKKINKSKAKQSKKKNKKKE